MSKIIKKSENIGTFNFKTNVHGHREKIHGCIFLDKNPTLYTARVDNVLVNNFTAKSAGEAAIMAIQDFLSSK